MLDEDRVESFTVRNAAYYLKHWRRFDRDSSSTTSFNKAAFFFALFWLIYRKLYVPLLWVLVVLAVDVSLTIYLEESRSVPVGVLAFWDRVSPLIYGGVIGTFGNYWYWRKFQKTETQSLSQSPDPGIRVEYLRSKGGTNPIGVSLVIIGIAALIALSFVPLP